MQPQELASALQSALALYGRGAFLEAERACEAILRLAPHNADAMMVRAIAAFSLGRLDEAEKWNGRAIAANPQAPEAWSNRGIARLQLGKLKLALKDLDRAIILRPNFPEAHSNRGTVLSKLNRLTDALQAYEAALRVRPAFPDALSGRGYVLCEFGRLSEARLSCEAALRLQADHADAWNNLGLTLKLMGDPEGAEGALNRALTLKPEGADALHNRGLVRLSQRDFKGGIEDLTVVRARRRTYPGVASMLLFGRLNVCAWDGLNDLLEDCRVRHAEGEPEATPIQMMAVSDNPAEIRRVAELTMNHLAARFSEPLPPIPARARRARPLRVAYLSADFRQHPCATMVVELIERHDRSAVVPIGISIGPLDDSDIGRRVRKAFSTFIDAATQTDREIAATVRALNVDVAVDQMGHTEHSRPRIFLHRAAPVQVCFQGYPGTTANPQIDYLVADAVVVPPDYERHFREKICRLPSCYHPTNPGLAIGPTPSRLELGLPEDAFVFASFNNSWKVTPEIFAVWMRLLAAREASILWMAAANELAKANLRRRAEAHGVDPERIVFAPTLADHADHLGRLRSADLFLDSAPYNAHTTACDALLAHLPIVTYLGKTFCGRVGASVLGALGLPELVAENQEGYEALALALSRDAAARTVLRQRIAANIRTHPLFAMDLYARNLERAYQEMAERAGRGDAPQTFDVADLVD